MPELLTPRLRCSPLQLDDWSFFLYLQQDTQVMLYVADPRPQAAIREAFDSRLPPWAPGDEHWLCLVVRDRLTHTPLGLTGYLHHQRDIAAGPQSTLLGHREQRLDDQRIGNQPTKTTEI